MISSILMFILLPTISTACSTTASNTAGGGLCVDVGGYHLYAQVFGKLAPTVIFDSGSGDDSTVWSAVAPEVSKFSRVVIYDRAGLGKSDQQPGIGLNTSQVVVDALRRLLKKEHIKPPYILVGHSAGGLNMQLFAQKYPEEIAGMVLIDSSSRNQDFGVPPPKKSNDYQEFLAFENSRKQVKNAEPFPPVPLIVLTATSHHDEKPQQKILWQKWQREMAKLSPNGIQILAWGSNHYIQKQQPQLIIDAIYTIITGLGKGSSQVQNLCGRQPGQA